MKDGKIHEGRITFESDPKDPNGFVTIKVSISASIKETRNLGRKDIAEITKDAEDDVAFGKIKPLIPTGSLMTASAYQTALKTGPDAFLASFPGSKHEAEVKKIQKVLSEELDKVERGNIKIEGEWYTPQDKIDFKALIGSRVHLLRMKASAKQGNYNGLIGAMREYQVIEEQYFGTPAYPEALKLAQQVVPALGGRLTRMQRDVEAANAEWEKNKGQLDEAAQMQVVAAREREEKNYQAGLSADKKASIKWVRLNPRSKASIDGYLNLAKAEMAQLQVYDIAKLEEQATALVEVDQLIAKGNLALAKVKIEKASAIDLNKPKEDSTSSSGRSKRSSRSRKSRSKKGTMQYLPLLKEKIKTKTAEAAKLKKAAEEAKKSESLTKNLKSTGEKMPKIEGKKPEGKEGEENAKSPTSNADAFAALAQGGKKTEKPDDKKKPSSQKPKKKTSSSKSSEKKKTPSTAPVEYDNDGGGLSMSTIMIGVFVLLAIAIGVMKFLGIGGKKED